jgi:hypothetical protein
MQQLCSSEVATMQQRGSNDAAAMQQRCCSDASFFLNFHRRKIATQPNLVYAYHNVDAAAAVRYVHATLARRVTDGGANSEDSSRILPRGRRCHSDLSVGAFAKIDIPSDAHTSQCLLLQLRGRKIEFLGVRAAFVVQAFENEPQIRKSPYSGELISPSSQVPFCGPSQCVNSAGNKRNK